MSATQTETKNRTRENFLDLGILCVAVALAFGAVLEFELLGLAAGVVVMSVAAALVIRRQVGSHDPADQPTTDDVIVVPDGSRVDD